MTVDVKPLNLLILSGFGAPFAATVKQLDAVAAQHPSTFPYLKHFLDQVEKVAEQENVRLSNSKQSILDDSILPVELRGRDGCKDLVALVGLDRRNGLEASSTEKPSTGIPGLPVMIAVGMAHAIAQIGTLIWYYEKTVGAGHHSDVHTTILDQLSLWAITGFCGGYVPAFAAAASTTIEDLVAKGLGAVRVGYWVGAAGEAARRQGLAARHEGLGGEPRMTNLKGWGCVLGSLASEQAQADVKDFNERHSQTEPKWASDLFISAKLEPSCVMVTGTPDQLDVFVEEQQIQAKTDNRRVTRLHIPGPFHSQHFHKQTFEAALKKINEGGGVGIASTDELVSRLIHTIDGTLAGPGSNAKHPFNGPEEMLRVCLIDSADWPRVASSIADHLSNVTSRELQITSIGPNPGAAKQLLGMLQDHLRGSDMSVSFFDINEGLM